jgi:DNA polymerase III subunit epsilon
MAADRPHEYLAFDLETTGLSPKTDRIVEVGAVRFDAAGRELGRFERLVNPERPISPGARAVNGLSDVLLATQSLARVVLPEFLDFLGDPTSTTLLAHSASFDAAFLGHEIARLGRPPLAHVVADTLPLARAKLPHLPNHRLDTLARVLNLDPSGPHRALADSLRVMGLWLALKGTEAGAGPVVAYRLTGETRPAGWDKLDEAIAQGWTVRIEYDGGTRGLALREITPKSFRQRGGVAFLVAHCHLDAIEKAFRLDRVSRFEVISPVVNR